MSSSTSFSKLMNRPHLKVVRMLGYVLTLGTQDAWWGLVPVLMARLTVEERAALAFMALKALDRDDATMTAEAALDQGAGQPQAPLFSHMDQAAFWADMADPEELEAYCLASFNAMPRVRQAAFLEYVQGRQAA
ncbi:hypothetical protein DZK27_14760 [Rhodobacteraceae bacterium 63075]|nr:hypothetical protein DZK27_14760 [Rhodobacteraceae bacterium 63075]